MLGSGSEVFRIRHSFPSGHSTFVFLLLTSLAPGAAWPIRWLLLGLALWVSWARIAVGAHFPADVLGGALLGIFCALVACGLVQIIFARRAPMPPAHNE